MSFMRRKELALTHTLFCVQRLVEQIAAHKADIQQAFDSEVIQRRVHEISKSSCATLDKALAKDSSKMMEVVEVIPLLLIYIACW